MVCSLYVFLFTCLFLFCVGVLLLNAFAICVGEVNVECYCVVVVRCMVLWMVCPCY